MEFDGWAESLIAPVSLFMLLLLCAIHNNDTNIMAKCVARISVSDVFSMLINLMYSAYFFSNGYAFLLTTALGLDTDKRYQLIEDVFAQADVVDNKYMQVGQHFTDRLT